MSYNIDTALQNALNCAEMKDKEGLLIPASLYDQEIHDKIDAETIYSIASLYADDVNNDGTWDAIIEDTLVGLYSGYA